MGRAEDDPPLEGKRELEVNRGPSLSSKEEELSAIQHRILLPRLCVRARCKLMQMAAFEGGKAKDRKIMYFPLSFEDD